MESTLNSIAAYLTQQSCQVAVVFGLVLVATQALRGASAHWRYLLWLVVIAKCIVPPVFMLPLAVLPQNAPLDLERRNAANIAATSREVLVHVYRCDMQILAICATNRSTGAVTREFDELATACRDRSIHIVIVGNGPSPDEKHYHGSYCGSFSELRSVIETQTMKAPLVRPAQGN